ncbi:hypothetical protein TruAng_012112 [Truncatella angustata]|nr:hypothetical protein TruAng_012112 [Truncatella angustata]
MPTPSSNPPPELPRSHSSSCPEELRASTSGWRSNNDGLEEMHIDSDSSSPEPASAMPEASAAVTEDVDIDTRSNTESPRPISRSGNLLRSTSEETEVDGPSQPSSKTMETDRVTPTDDKGKLRSLSDRSSSAFDVISPASAHHEKTEDVASANGRLHDDLLTPSMGYEYSNLRLIPTTTSSFLRPGSLTEDNPTLTTFFEGEIIGSKYGFITNHADWGSTDKIDVSHWNKFTAFRPYAKTVRKGGNIAIPNLGSKDNIFMRWKERFLVPDHRVRTINGASFEGFYYICFNQKLGTISGIYFHAKSEKFQQLELKHVEDRGCFGAMEFSYKSKFQAKLDEAGVQSGSPRPMILKVDRHKVQRSWPFSSHYYAASSVNEPEDPSFHACQSQLIDFGLGFLAKQQGRPNIRMAG